MLNKVKQQLKNEKGLTLIELLAVVVILGIIAAIAIPSIGGLINNSKKDAHIANAQQMVNVTKLALTAEEDGTSTDGGGNKAGTYTLKYLIDNGYIEDMKDPSGTKYNKDSYVAVNGTTYKVYLSGDTDYIGSSNSPIDLSTIKRNDVKLQK